MPYKFRDIEKRLKKLGFVIVRQKGSHVVFGQDNRVIIVPLHSSKDITVGVEHNILKNTGLTKEEFKNCLKK